MKRYIFLILIFLGDVCMAQCPFQIINCKGKCPRFTNLNGDSFCDYTQIIEFALTDSLTFDSLTSTNALSIKNNLITDSSLSKNSNLKTKPIPTDNSFSNTSLGENVKARLKNVKNFSAKDVKSTQPKTSTAVLIYKRYSLFPISFLCIFLYLCSFFMAKFRLISIRVHRKIWNMLLAITFFVTGIIGLFMVIQLNYSFSIGWFKSLLNYHVGFGIGMLVIAVFHFLWHWDYMKKIFNFKPVKSDK